MNLRHGAEKAFLLAALRRFVTGEQGPPLSLDGLRRSWLQQVIERGRIGHVLHEVLPAGAAPEAWRRRWGERRQAVFVRNSRSLSAAVKALAVLEEAGAAAAVCRGAALCATVYPDWSLRLMDDVDALVSPGGWERGMKALERAFGPPCRRLRSQNVWDIEGAHFEFHWRYLTTRRLRGRVDTDFLLEDRRPAETPFGRLVCLETTRELAAVVVHLLAHHGLGHYAQLMDIAMLAQRPDVDWELLAKWSRARGLDRMILFAVGFAGEVFQIPLEEKLAVFGPPLSRFWRRSYQGHMASLFRDRRLTDMYQAKASVMFMSGRTLDQVRQAMRLVSFEALAEALRCAGLLAPTRPGSEEADQ